MAGDGKGGGKDDKERATPDPTLIGMPGAGKSTVGVLLAKRLVRRFIDTDLLIQERAGRSLQDVIDTDGYAVLRHLEEQVLLDVPLAGSVIATGGSAVYSNPGMERLAAGSTIVYLKVPLAVVEARIGDFSERGIAKPDNQSIEDVFRERTALYDRWADVTVDASRPTEAVLEEILAALGRGG